MRIDDPRIAFAPYVWRITDAYAEANMPGAYIRSAFRDSSVIRVLIDG